MGFFESWSSPWGKLFDFVNRLLGWLPGPLAFLALPFLLLNWFVSEFVGGIVLQKVVEIGDAVDQMALQLDLPAIPVDLGQVATMFPITFFFGLLGAYVAVWAIVLVVKWILKLIPTVG